MAKAPSRYKELLQVKVLPEEKERLRREAEAEGRPISELVRARLFSYAEGEEKGRATEE